MALLTVEHLRVSFRTEGGTVHAVDDVSFALQPGEVLGIVGESGSGKSVTAMTLLGLTRSPNATFSGRAVLEATAADPEVDLLAADERGLQHVRGKRVAMVFQDPMTALNPVHRVGDQIAEQVRAHSRVSRSAARDRAADLLRRVGIPRAAERARAYPHEFSGGMRQRVMIAMALSCDPQVLVADEPTTALDVTIQAQILAEIEDLRAETGVGVLLITHDLGVIAEVADRVVVMYAGRVVEQGGLRPIFTDPLHPYTWGLLGSVPRIDRDRPERLPTIGGTPPSLLAPPAGCHFKTRCPHRFGRCDEVPELRGADPADPGHSDRCWLDLAAKREKRVVDGAIGLPLRPTGAVR
ncbi:MAG TPA: ABC transporter ATP-binding protein [Acidimicrobiales bacterium]|nr:ABC transporter ATP-binding protein [Acidimicrobiales bacterium]